jgi:hypothetical protein
VGAGHHPAAAEPHALARVRRGLSGKQPPHALDRFGERAYGRAGLDPGIGEIAGSARPQADHHSPRGQLVERRRRHRDVHGMHDVGTHRHQHRPRGGGRLQHDGGRAERIAEEEVARDPEAPHAGGFRGARLLAQPAERITTVERDAE